MILFLDTNVVIYAVKKNPAFSLKTILRLVAARSAGDSFLLSDLTRMECLAGPLRSNDTAVEASYRAFFARSDVQCGAITAAVCDRAARIRATHPFKSMDALQLAAAVEHGASTFLTADARLGSYPDLSVEILK